MAYTKQSFEDGQVLTAEHLNHMEQGIAAPDWNDVTNRPFYSEQTVIVERQTVDLVDQGGGYMATFECSIPLSVGDAITVNFNGTETEHVLEEFYGFVAFGDLVTFTPYGGMYDSSIGSVVFATATETLNATIEITGTKYHQIPEKYLPANETLFVKFWRNNDDEPIQCSATFAEVQSAHALGKTIVARCDYLGGPAGSAGNTTAMLSHWNGFNADGEEYVSFSTPAIFGSYSSSGAELTIGKIDFSASERARAYSLKFNVTGSCTEL